MFEFFGKRFDMFAILPATIPSRAEHVSGPCW